MEDNQNAEVSIVPNKVHVTGFPMYTQPQDLERVFSEYGEVKVDKLTKRYATLEFNKVEEAKAAIKHSKKLAVYGELISVRPYYTKPLSILKPPKREKPQFDKGRKILSPSEISLSGEFDEQLENIMMAIRLTQEEVMQITELYSDLEGVLQVAWPGCRAIPFGSITTGLGVKCSDADCFISIPKELQHTNDNYIMKARRVLLANKQLFSDIVPIPLANTPIIKLYHLPSRTHCDLTFKTPLGTHNSRLIHFLLHADPRLLPLAVLLRYWACAHGFTGTRRLTNYALTMLLLFYLQQPPAALLPPVRRLQRDPAHSYLVDHWDAGFDSDPSHLPRRAPHAPRASVAELLAGFFQYYAAFDFNEMVVCPYLGYPVKKELFYNTSNLPPGFERYKTNVDNRQSFPIKITSPMCIQDPFEHSHNVACGISIKIAIDLWTLFNFAVSAYETEKLNGCRDFLSIILLQKPKMFGIKHITEYKCNISQRDVIAIQTPNWKSVIRDVAEDIFCQILRIPLNKGEEKIIDSQKEKVTFITKATRAVWRRKHSSKMCYLRRSEFLKRQKSVTEEAIEAETQTFELDFQLDIVFTNEPRKARIGIRYLNGDKELFREFGKFFSSIINPWYKTLLRPHSLPDHGKPDHGKPDHGKPDHGKSDHGTPESPETPDSPDCDDVEEPDCDDEEPDCDDEEPDGGDEEPDGDEEEPDSK